MVDHDLDDAAVVAVVVVEGELVGDPQADEQGDGHAGSQPGDIDDRMRPVFPQIAYGDDEIVSEHALVFEIQQKHSQNNTRFFIP